MAVWCQGESEKPTEQQQWHGSDAVSRASLGPAGAGFYRSGITMALVCVACMQLHLLDVHMLFPRLQTTTAS